MGPGQIANAVRSTHLLNAYAEALDGLAKTLTGPLHSRPAPETGVLGKTLVSVGWSSREGPFATMEKKCSGGGFYVPMLVLPWRYFEPDQAGELRRAKADATHEATHAFNFVQKPLIDRSTGFAVRDGVAAWKWFDEATAIFMESKVNNDWLRFALDWVDRPNVPLDSPTEPAVYRAGLFARYLVRAAKDPAFLSRVWLDGVKDSDPFVTLQRLLGTRPFCSPRPDDDDMFASGFCMDSYFVWEQEAAVHRRFLERGVEYSWELSTADGRNSISSVHPLPLRLACLYFRFFLEPGSEIFR